MPSDDPVGPVGDEKPRPVGGLVADGAVLETQSPVATCVELLEKHAEQKTEQPAQEADVEKNAETENSAQDVESKAVMSGTALTILTISFTVATFMVALDGSILATAIPRITSGFNSLDEIGWYGSAYLLTEMSTQPTFGRIYTYFDAKPTYLLSLLLFELGSIICATAPTSLALIFGRAISGTGAAGMLCGSLVIFGQVVPLRTRPFGMALMTSVYGFAGVLGPTLGGLMTDSPRLTWRFCFWINLPFGVLAAIAMFFVLQRKAGVHKDLPLKQKLWNLNMVSGFILNCGLVSLFLALEWGGNIYPWSNSKVWGCLLGFFLLTAVFIFIQGRSKDKAMIPPRIALQRTVFISCVFEFLYCIAVTTHSYYLPLYFQAVRGNNAAQSGLYGLPYGITLTIGTIISGAIMTSTGYYVPMMYIGSSVLTAGCALIYTLNIDTSVGKWLGYQIVAGLGLGLGVQVPFIAVQVVVSAADMPMACALIEFARCFGGAIGLSIAENIFSTSLLSQLMQIPGISTDSVIAAGAGDVSNAITPALVRVVQEAYSFAITKVYILPIAVAALSALCVLGMEWKRIEDDRPKVGIEESTLELSAGKPSMVQGNVPNSCAIESSVGSNVETSEKQ